MVHFVLWGGRIMKKKFLSLVMVLTMIMSFVPVINVQAFQNRSYNFNKSYTLIEANTQNPNGGILGQY